MQLHPGNVNHYFIRVLNIGVNSITSSDKIADFFAKRKWEQSSFSNSMEGTSELWWVSGNTCMWTMLKEASYCGCAALWDLLQGGKVKLESLPPWLDQRNYQPQTYEKSLFFSPRRHVEYRMYIGLTSCHLSGLYLGRLQKRSWN